MGDKQIYLWHAGNTQCHQGREGFNYEIIRVVVENWLYELSLTQVIIRQCQPAKRHLFNNKDSGWQGTADLKFQELQGLHTVYMDTLRYIIL